MYEHRIPDRFMKFVGGGKDVKDVSSFIQLPSDIPIRLSFSITSQEQEKVMKRMVQKASNPSLSTSTNSFRQGPSDETRNCFQQCLLGAMRASWKDRETESQFLYLAHLLEEHGCAIFTGLIDIPSFEILIQSFSDAMETAGRGAFLHSYINLADQPGFLKDARFNSAFAHPLLIALMAYCMGGPVAMTDVRGKDTPPICVNAQDNMLHIDNSPFRQEFKILLCWERGVPKGPDGQNFVFLPSTHKGNRNIRFDSDGNPWSTENDSVFLEDEALTRILHFQNTVTNSAPTIVEVKYPEQPIAVLFSAASLVHHRYRTVSGKSRSCIIAAFHLANENSGSLIGDTALEEGNSLREAIVSRREELTPSNFISLLIRDAAKIETKIHELSSPTSELSGSLASVLQIEDLALSGSAFGHWRDTVLNSPSTSGVKMSRGVCLTRPETQIEQDELLQVIVEAMVYDKHGMLDLILYHDGREEVRKPARKLIWSMVSDEIKEAMESWIGKNSQISYDFFVLTLQDILEPMFIKNMVDDLAAKMKFCLDGMASKMDRAQGSSGQIQMMRSFHQLLIDLAESIVRCEKIETYVSTNLFIFWTLHHLLPVWDVKTARQSVNTCLVILRCYLASAVFSEM